MPFTPAHAAAVVPLRRFCKSPYTYSALVVGSMAPDFEYFIRLRPVAVIGHTALGLVVFCLPVGLLALWLFHFIVKRPGLTLLPWQVRTRLGGAAASNAPISWRLAVTLGALVVVGAVTHDVWDSLTHADGGVVTRIPALSATVLQIGGVDVAVYKLLQHGSTIAGLAILTIVAARATAHVRSSLTGVELPATLRWSIVLALGAGALIGSVIAGIGAGGAGTIAHQLQLASGRMIVVAIAIFVAGLLAYGAIYTIVERKRRLRPSSPATIRRYIDQLASGRSGDVRERAARQFDALPIYNGWGGWALLTTEGEVLEADENDKVTPAMDPMRTLYLVIGAEKYPELTALLPARPRASVDCEQCKGTGWMMSNGKPLHIRCGHCRALGWVET